MNSAPLRFPSARNVVSWMCIHETCFSMILCLATLFKMIQSLCISPFYQLYFQVVSSIWKILQSDWDKARLGASKMLSIVWYTLSIHDCTAYHMLVTFDNFHRCDSWEILEIQVSVHQLFYQMSGIHVHYQFMTGLSHACINIWQLPSVQWLRDIRTSSRTIAECSVKHIKM